MARYKDLTAALRRVIMPAVDPLPGIDEPTFVLGWVDSITDGLVRQGVFDPNGKSREQLRQEFHAWFATDGEEYIRNLHIAIDHKAQIRGEARRYLDRGSVELAAVMYATHFEHWLNGVLSWGGVYRDLDQDDVVKMIRASLDSKLTYIWQLVFDERLDEQILSTIKRVADARNAFVHYKWRSYHVDSTDIESQHAALADLLADCDRVIELAEKYEWDLYARFGPPA